eukprot:37799-Chlamydomonas_euryale.AAC.1
MNAVHGRAAGQSRLPGGELHAELGQRRKVGRQGKRCMEAWVICSRWSGGFAANWRCCHCMCSAERNPHEIFCCNIAVLPGSAIHTNCYSCFPPTVAPPMHIDTHRSVTLRCTICTHTVSAT